VVIAYSLRNTLLPVRNKKADNLVDDWLVPVTDMVSGRNRDSGQAKLMARRFHSG
jgi:hypothetical protein